jgi:serine/threonine-protein kinase
MVEPPSQELFAGKFRLLRLLGKGAMGEVWLAHEVGPRNFTRQVAVKRLLATEGISEYARESFIAEAQVIARLDHPNIVRLIELGESDERGLYLVLEYVDGVSLDRVFRKTGALSAAAVAFVGREVAAALDAVHSMGDEYGNNLGVVHRDVSPGNILVARDGRVRLSDFGVARIHGLGGEKTETGVFKGKLPYMPPEQALGEPFDGRADVFSLGITLVEALIGGRLRKAETQGQLIATIATERVARVHQVFPRALPMLAEALDRTTEFRAADRMASAGLLASTLHGILQSLGPGTEERAVAELADRVATVMGGTPVSTARQPWSIPLASGAIPTLGSVPGSSGSYPQHGAPGTAGPRTSAGGSVPPEGNASVTRVASFTDAAAQPASSRAWAIVLAVGALVGIGSGAAWVFYLGVPDGGAPSAVPASTAPASNRGVDATEHTSGPGVSAEQPASSTPADSALAAASSPPGSEPVKQGPPLARNSASAAPTTATEQVGTGTLQVTVSPWGNVTVGGRSYGMTPIGPITLPAGTHTVVVTNPELGASRSATVRVTPGKQAAIGFDLKRSQ